MTWLIGYKIVFYDFQRKVYTNYLYNAQSMEYIIGRISCRPITENGLCGPITIFDCLEKARKYNRNFVMSPEHSHIFKAEYIKSEEKLVYRYEKFHTTVFTLKNSDLPEGTVLADKIRLVEEVPQMYT